MYNFTLESVIQHHSEAVSSVEWSLANDADQESTRLEDLRLMSSSFDFTVCVWMADAKTEIWSVDSTLGAMVGNKHAYFGAMFLKSVDQILAYTYGGAMHQWEKHADSGAWEPKLTVKGHFAAVSDIAWDESYLSLISTSTDQTTRILSEHSTSGSWYEFSRPQIHGYDMNAITTVRNAASTKDATLSSKILSGGDEKVLRLFEAPYNYIKTLNGLNPHIDSESKQLRFSPEYSNAEIESRLESDAKKQPLGLMNKGVVLLANKGPRVNEEEEGGAGVDFDPITVLSNKNKVKQLIKVEEPPVEDILMARTLWPEQQKLYGHVFEVFCVAATTKGDCAASACKAKEAKYAEIVIWDMTKGHTTVPVCKLAAHKLTVVQLEFSKNDQYLLSCSRDRQWALFERSEDPATPFKFDLLKLEKDAHSRIIWGISWSHDDALFATASREKQHSVKVWNGVGDKIGTLHSELPNSQAPSATAV